MNRIACQVFIACLVAGSARAEIVELTSSKSENLIRPVVLVLSADWFSKIPPTGPVNAPEYLSTVYPGQKVALGLLAEGPDQDRLLQGVTINARFIAGGGAATTEQQLSPVASRRIKAKGADFALEALRAGGISDADRAKVEEASSVVTLAIFATDWTVPVVDSAAEVEISVSIAGTAVAGAIQPAALRVKTVEDWISEPAPTEEEIGKQMNHYLGDMPPGQLLSWFRALAGSRSLEAPPVHGFFVFALKSNPALLTAAVDHYPAFETEIQPALLWVLQLGGHDLKTLFPTLSGSALAPFAPLEPIADPRKLRLFEDPIDAQTIRRIGNTMDQCWAGWMASGDKSFLRALVGLLEGAPHHHAFQVWQESRGGVEGLNADVAKGLAYQIAGWSIGSFQRTDPLVADWLIHWERDPNISAAIRQEIATLNTNPAFKRK